MKKKRNKLERKLDEYNHTMELIRTILPFIILLLQVYIAHKAYLRNFNLTPANKLSIVKYGNYSLWSYCCNYGTLYYS